MAEQFQEWYNVSLTQRCKPNMAKYWNMRLGKLIYINGSLLNQLEPVLFEVSELAFGIHNTKFPNPIRTRLELVRQNEVI